jgi:hypothetical protein
MTGPEGHIDSKESAGSKGEEKSFASYELSEPMTVVTCFLSFLFIKMIK